MRKFVFASTMAVIVARSPDFNRGCQHGFWTGDGQMIDRICPGVATSELLATGMGLVDSMKGATQCLKAATPLLGWWCPQAAGVAEVAHASVKYAHTLGYSAQQIHLLH